MPNPFFYGGRITDPQFFVGRKNELRRIFAALETAYTGQVQHMSIVGPRRIGKSSLLYHVTRVYSDYLIQSERYRFVYIDLEDPHCHTLPGLLDHILNQLDVRHSSKVNLEKFQEAIIKLRQQEDWWPVLCLDEFERLTVHQTEFNDELFEAWRSLANASQVSFLTASQTSLDVLTHQGKLTSPFYNIFILLPLGEFSEEEARQMLARGQTCDRPFTDQECNAIQKLAGMHPFKLQVAGSLVYERKADHTSVGWLAVRREYRKQIDYTFGAKPSGWNKILKWIGRSLG